MKLIGWNVNSYLSQLFLWWWRKVSGLRVKFKVCGRGSKIIACSLWCLPSVTASTSSWSLYSFSWRQPKVVGYILSFGYWLRVVYCRSPLKAQLDMMLFHIFAPSNVILFGLFLIWKQPPLQCCGRPFLELIRPHLYSNIHLGISSRPRPNGTGKERRASCRSDAGCRILIKIAKGLLLGLRRKTDGSQRLPLQDK